MKIKIIDMFGYQTYPLDDTAIEVSEDIIAEIGKTKCFDVENNRVIDFDNSEILAERHRNERMSEIKDRLNQLSEDLVQDMAGEAVPNIEARKAEFIVLHNELRELEGKEPRLRK